jgi:folate-binding protein YgfZ
VTLALSPTQLDPLEISAGRLSAAELAEAKVWNELAVMDAVSLTKGCWMGQEVVRRVHVLGETKRLLRGVRIDAPHGVGWAGATLEDAAGSAAGTVTRAARAPFLGATIGLAFVRRDATPGATLTARRADGTAAAVTVHALPFVARRPAGAPEPAWIPRENP